MDDDGWKADYKPMHLIIEGQNGKGAIYLGGIDSAEDLDSLKKNQISAVLTAAYAPEISYSKDEFTHLHIPADDMPDYQIDQHFETCNEFIKENIQKTNILVHCYAGISRSSSVLIAYLMKERGMAIGEAFKVVQTRRRIAQPNRGFVEQLKKYGESLKYS